MQTNLLGRKCRVIFEDGETDVEVCEIVGVYIDPRANSPSVLIAGADGRIYEQETKEIKLLPPER